MLGVSSSILICLSRFTTYLPSGLTYIQCYEYLDEDLLLSHNLDNFSDVRVDLMQAVQLLLEARNVAVQLSPLGFQSLDVLHAFLDLLLFLLDFAQVVLLEARSLRHFQIFFKYNPVLAVYPLHSLEQAKGRVWCATASIG